METWCLIFLTWDWRMDMRSQDSSNWKSRCPNLTIFDISILVILFVFLIACLAMAGIISMPSMPTLLHFLKIGGAPF
jgi:hypothetical protein